MCHLAGDVEKPILRLDILKLGTELKLRTFDMIATAFLSEICLVCPEYMGKHVYVCVSEYFKLTIYKYRALIK